MRAYGLTRFQHYDCSMHCCNRGYRKTRWCKPSPNVLRYVKRQARAEAKREIANYLSE